jgi:tetratricopeptide (TPR) repeat protein
MAFIQIRLKNHEEAERLLDQGVGFVHQFEEQTGKHANLGFYHELRSRLAFKKGRYQEALEASLASIEEYELDGDAFRATQAKSGAAYFMILTGRVEEGLTLTKEVDDVIFRADGLEQLSFYNAINWLQGYRCKGKPYDDLEKQLKNRIASHKDQFLKEHLEFALKWDCGRIE